MIWAGFGYKKLRGKGFPGGGNMSRSLELYTTKNLQKSHNSNGLLSYFIKSKMPLIVKMRHDLRDIKTWREDVHLRSDEIYFSQ